MRSIGRRLRDTRGGVLVLVAVSLVALMSAMAIAVDLAMLFRARADAQRAADATALAGASAFLDGSGPTQNPIALQRAEELAALNHVSNTLIDVAGKTVTTIPGDGSRLESNEVTIEVLPAEERVRVWVRRAENFTWFANLFGVNLLPVQAYAAARASPAGSAKCLKPIAMPDIWYDANNDANGNRIWDPSEKWLFGDHPADRYAKYTGNGGAPDETGYGGNWRNPPMGDNRTIKDFGRRLQLKTADPQDPYNPQPGIFLPWRLPYDPDQEPCDNKGGGGETAGGAVFRRNICSCNTASVELGQPYDVEPGDMVGPTFQGFKELVDEDPNAVWDETADGGKGAVVNHDPKYGSWMNSPRVVKVALFEPGQITQSGMQSIVFNNFGLFFIERQQNPQAAVEGRFITYVSGEDEGPVAGPLVKILRLVE